MATLRHTIANLVSVPYTMLHLGAMKLFYPRNVFFSGVERFSPGVVIDTDRKSTLRFGRRVSMHSRCRVVSNEGGCISIGDHTSFNVGCIVVSKSRIAIGRNVSFGPNVMIYDHNHVMRQSNGAKGDEFTCGSVEIGDNCWIGAGTIILMGTRIGENCVIAAGSVVKGDIPADTTLIQKRINTYKGTE